MRTGFRFVAIMLSLFFQSCGSAEVQRQDFVGIWKSDDGAVIELKADGSYVAREIDYYKIYFENEHKGKKLNFIGQWEIADENKKSKLELHTDATFKDVGINKTYTYNGEVRSHKLGLTFEISGEGLFENKPPWYLFIWIGDPDDMNKYKFVKQ